MPAIVLENIRSCYNVWNIIRTADALWFDIIISGYTPSPFDNTKVLKTSLGSEKSVNIYHYYNTKQAIEFTREKYKNLIAAEITNKSISLSDFVKKNNLDTIAIVFGNEVDGVLPETLNLVDSVVHIDMLWIKESLNVGQTTAIFMREIWKLIKVKY